MKAIVGKSLHESIRNLYIASLGNTLDFAQEAFGIRRMFEYMRSYNEIERFILERQALDKC
jgi:hypothetical protein